MLGLYIAGLFYFERRVTFRDLWILQITMSFFWNLATEIVQDVGEANLAHRDGTLVIFYLQMLPPLHR